MSEGAGAHQSRLLPRNNRFLVERGGPGLTRRQIADSARTQHWPSKRQQPLGSRHWDISDVRARYVLRQLLIEAEVQR